MADWTEETLRSAASWKAFKEGKALFDAGAVTNAAATSNGWRATVGSGKRPIRVSVAALSPTHLEVRCPCPENQATGAVCCHAVAAGLAMISGPKAPPAAAAETRPAVETRAFCITLPVNWLDSLARGRLTATLSFSQSREPDTADHELAQWLNRSGARFQDPLNLHLDESRTAEFLLAATEHPEIRAGKEHTPVQIRSGARIAIQESTLLGEHIRLIPAPDPSTWRKIGQEYWRIHPHGIQRAGNGAVPAAMAPILSGLIQGTAVEYPTRGFLENLVPWQEWIEFSSADWLSELHFVPAAAEFRLALDGSIHELSARLSVVYGGNSPVIPGYGNVDGLPRIENGRCLVRDFSTEKAAVRILQNAGFTNPTPAATPWTLSGEAQVTAFLAHSLPGLRDSWAITETPRFVKLRNEITVVSPRIHVLGSGQDWLGFELSFESTAGDYFPTEEIRKLLRSGTSQGRLRGGQRMVIDEQALQLVEPLFSELELRQVDGHYEASRASAQVILEIREKLLNQKITSDLSASFTYHSPPRLSAELRPYQASGAAWLLDRIQHFGGALLADDMGLGKTVQTIASIEHLFTLPSALDRTVLVVATASLLGNWRAEFGKFAPARMIRILHGSGRDQEREQIQGGEVILTSYGTLARDLAWHLKREYLAVVIDEASLMRNPDTDHAKAVCKLRSQHRIALTGTPVENSVRDLWSLFRFIQPGWLGSREEFRDRYEIPLQAGDSARSVMERLKLKTRPFLLRRTKEQVAPELPSKIFIDEFCDLSAEQQAVYKDLLIEGRKRVDALNDSNNPGAARMQILSALLRLRQTCCDLALLESDRLNQLLLNKRSSKMERLLELLEEAILNGHKILVFSQFQKQLLKIEEQLVSRSWASLRLDGQSRNRQDLVDRFQSADGPPVFLISLKAGGYGLNLTAADIVIHFDPWWNPAAEAQATDRAHRIGQTRPVTVYRLLTRGTIEEKVVRLQSKKRDLAAGIDESGDGDAPAWTMDDMAAVMRD